ncbi:hypothetical protein HJFPF1_07602 [Paramyrothecium foliicola]|nr:hypothetical protein HJFPF1_07602 [Paramyrothecium foliicola]
MDDKDKSLDELSRYHQESIVSQLVHIGSKHNQLYNDKYLPFIRNLQCLRRDGLHLYRTSIDAYDEEQYVALSYTWNRSKYEDDKSGRYHVEAWNGNRLEPSKVRNCVLDRVTSYMRYKKVEFLWIDRHCIHQDTCDFVCARHSHCVQKQNAIQAMDRVYQLSTHPIALLGWRLRREYELHLLGRILLGKFVGKGSKPRLSRGTTIHEARKALRLLHEITQDLWWQRAWTFQENYRGGTSMTLLIRHNPSLEQQKRQYWSFGRMRRELCINSVKFSKEATRLCLALRETIENVPLEEAPEDILWINDVFRAIGRYALLLDESTAMTPTIITDIEARGLSQPWDRLAIIANCCQYPIRLDSEKLQMEQSLSLSMLAMCLLNGEILNNNDEEPVAHLATSKFLNEKLFKSFSAPEAENQKLTFNKGCRLTNVELAMSGIVTKGILWELDCVIDTAMFPRKLPWIENPWGKLKLYQRRCLLQLYFQLQHIYVYDTLAKDILEFLDVDASVGVDSSFPTAHLRFMASEIVAAIQARKKLRLGRIWDPTGGQEPYSAVFVWPTKENDSNEADASPAFVFTSAWFRDPGSKSYEANDLDRHVSFEVGLEKSLIGNGSPHLRVRRWLPGMCFFPGRKLTEVVFPWPRMLQEVKP